MKAPKLESKRLTLRAILPADKEAVFVYRSEVITNQYQGWIPQKIEDVEEFIAKNQIDFNQPDTWFQLVIIEKKSNTLIGDIGLHFIDEQQVEVGCTIAKAVHQLGYASEALRKVVDYLFTHLAKHRLIASIDPANTASIKLVERLGFRKEGHFKESIFMNGQWLDDVVYAVLNREWC
jgi:RimJ/RimL family protein N-acetyltransferase